MLRRALLSASDSRRLRTVATEFGPARAVALRFVAGETLDDGAAVCRDLNDRGFAVTFDPLGEDVEDLGAADEHAAAARGVLDRIERDGLDASLSVKPTALGLTLDRQRCRRFVLELADRAAEIGTHVTLDMEGSEVTQGTIDLVVAAHGSGRRNVGCAVQTYLHRTPDDVRRLTELGASLRITKGAYREPEDIALQDRDAIADAFVDAADRVLRAGVYGRFATHDDRVIDRIRNLARRHRTPIDRYEFQMLYGVRTPLQHAMVRAGHRVRIYVPFGQEWYAYFMRRLAERPANLVFFLRALVGAREDGTSDDGAGHGGEKEAA